MYFVNFSVNIVRYAHCNYELFQEERKILLEKCMTVLQQYLSGIQKQDTNEWEKQVNPYHVANLQRMTDIVLAEISGTERLFKSYNKIEYMEIGLAEHTI